MDKFYFLLNPDVFVFQNGERILFYREHTPLLEFDRCMALEIAYAQWSDLDHLYCAELDAELWKEPILKECTDVLVLHQMAQLIPLREGMAKPFSIPPVVSVQRSKAKFKEREDILAAENFTEYLQKVVIYLNGEFEAEELRSKQFTYLWRKDGADMDIQTLRIILNQLKSVKANHLVFSGQDVFKYKYWQQCIAEMDVLNAKKEFYVDCAQLIEHIDYARSIHSEQYVFTVLVDRYHPFDPSLLEKAEGMDLHWFFLIASEEEYREVNQWIESYHLERVVVKPVYDQNLAFFESNIYLTRDDIAEIDLSKKEIFIHQSINSTDFGQLNILPDGSVYANLSAEVLGNANTKSFHDMIAHEICGGHSWLRIRDQQPCCDCLYQWLCPSPSNYERVIGKPNLCHIEERLVELQN